MRKSLILSFLLSSVLILGGCYSHKDITADLEAMSAKLEESRALIIAGDVDAIMDEFSDALKPTGYYPGQPAIEGRDALRRSWEAFFARGKVTELSVSEIHRKVYGDLAVVYGLWQMTQESEDGPLASSGAFTRVYGKKDGVWKIIHDHVSAVPPTEGMTIETEGESAPEA